MKYNFLIDKDSLLFTVLSNNLAGISLNALKALAKKGEIKLNGIKQKNDTLVKKGDSILIFLPQSFMPQKSSTLIYSDQNIVIVNKPPFYDVENNLLTEVKQDFPLAQAVHRLDRNTTGLVVFALNAAAYSALISAFKNRTIDKYYLARVQGECKKQGVFTAYLKKDADKALVLISQTPKPLYKKIITEIIQTPIGFCKESNTTSLMVRLVTGRTHQIRAHLSFLGYPILGDTKYGNTKKEYGYALNAFKITFKGLTKPLSYLNEKTFTLNEKTFTG